MAAVYKKPLLISSCGGAGAYPFLMGAMCRLFNLAKQQGYKSQEINLAGVSAGCIPALALRMGYDTPQKMRELIQNFLTKYPDMDGQPPSAEQLFNNWREFILSLISPNDRWKQCNHKLFIGISVWDSESSAIEPKIISEWTSAEDLADTILTSCHLVLLGLSFARQFRGQLAADGGITQRYVVLPNMLTIPVCYDAVYSQMSWDDFRIDLSLKKFDRLFEAGQQFINMHENDYTTLLVKGKHTNPKLHVNPSSWVPRISTTRLLIVVAIILVIISFIAYYLWRRRKQNQQVQESQFIGEDFFSSPYA